MRLTKLVLLAGTGVAAVGCVDDFGRLFADAGPSEEASTRQDGELPQSGDDPDRHRDGGWLGDAMHASDDADLGDGIASGNDGDVDALGRDGGAELDAGEVDARLPED
jgi:hypothetical protein